MKKLHKKEPENLEDWFSEVSDIKKTPQPDEPPQASLVIDAIQPSANTKGLYNHNSFNSLQVGDVSNIDRKLAEKFTSGKLKIEARLDLHGLTEQQAFTAVRDFIQNSYNHKYRCILIITGKGVASETWWESKGIIRQAFSNWLNHIEIRPYLLSVAQAVPHDGGAGAFYCLLKRHREA